MITTDNTLIIFGRSPFINDVKDFIPMIIKKFPYCVGCNSFFLNFPEIPYSAFVDKNQAKLFIDYEGKIFTTKANLELVKYLNNDCKTYYIDKFEDKTNWMKNEHAFILYDTPSFIMSLAVKRNFENIVLIGVDYNPANKGHFNDNKSMTWIEDKKFIESREFVENKITQYLNVYSVNPDRIINVPFIDIREL